MKDRQVVRSACEVNQDRRPLSPCHSARENSVTIPADAPSIERGLAPASHGPKTLRVLGEAVFGVGTFGAERSIALGRSQGQRLFKPLEKRTKCVRGLAHPSRRGGVCCGCGAGCSRSTNSRRSASKFQPFEDFEEVVGIESGFEAFVLGAEF